MFVTVNQPANPLILYQSGLLENRVFRSTFGFYGARIFMGFRRLKFISAHRTRVVSLTESFLFAFEVVFNHLHIVNVGTHTFKLRFLLPTRLFLVWVQCPE